MPIRAECECGKVYRVKEELAGRRFRCAACGVAVTVPQAEEEPLEVTLAEESEVRRPSRKGITARRDPEEDEQPVSRRSRLRDEEPDEDDTPEPPRKKKKKKRPSSSGGSWSGPSFGAIGGGLLAMIGAVVWFVAGLMNDVIFFYPPVLFVLGLISLGKGLTGQE